MNEWSHELRVNFIPIRKNLMDIIWKSRVFFLLRTSMWEEKKNILQQNESWIWYMSVVYGWMERFHLIAWSFILSIRFGNRFMSTNCNEESYSLASFAWNSGWCVSACGCVCNRLDVCMELTKCALKCVHMYTNPWSRCHFSL